jgi:hypothetical protein
MPFLFTTMAAILIFRKYERVSSAGLRFAWGAILASLVVASLMFASAAIALLGAMVASLIATFLRGKQLGLVRAQKVLPVLLVGVAVQGWWMHRKPAPPEWPLPGYPAPYLEQLRVKNGNHPELGFATLGDVLIRVESNIATHSDLLAQLVLRHGLNETNVAIVIAPVLLIVLGWVYSLWQMDGAAILEWYFAGYELIYLLWPWRVETRFFLPVAPLACMYAWIGIKAAYVVITSRPRITGIIWSPLGLTLAVSGSHWLYTHRVTNASAALRDELLVPMWLCSAIGAACMAYSGHLPTIAMPNLSTSKWLTRALLVFRANTWNTAQYGFRALIIILVGIGVSGELKSAKKNVGTPDAELTTNTDVNPLASEIQAGLWIESHTPVNAIVMARHLPLVYHYSHRQMTWFAPISDPDVLMEGIERHNVNYVIAIKHKKPYYLPDDDYCFDKLLTKHADAFRLVLQRTDWRVFEVLHHQ